MLSFPQPKNQTRNNCSAAPWTIFFSFVCKVLSMRSRFLFSPSEHPFFPDSPATWLFSFPHLNSPICRLFYTPRLFPDSFASPMLVPTPPTVAPKPPTSFPPATLPSTPSNHSRSFPTFVFFLPPAHTFLYIFFTFPWWFLQCFFCFFFPLLITLNLFRVLKVGFPPPPTPPPSLVPLLDSLFVHKEPHPDVCEIFFFPLVTHNPLLPTWNFFPLFSDFTPLGSGFFLCFVSVSQPLLFFFVLSFSPLFHYVLLPVVSLSGPGYLQQS